MKKIISAILFLTTILNFSFGEASPPESLSGLTLIESYSGVDSYDGSFYSGLETIHFPSATELVGVRESDSDTSYAETYSFSGSYKWRVEGSRGYLSTTSEDGTWLNLYELSFDSNTTGRSDLLDDSSSDDYNATFELVSIGSGLAPLSIADVMLEFNASGQDIASGGTTYTFFENGPALVSPRNFHGSAQYQYLRSNPDTGVVTVETPAAGMGTDITILTLDFSSADSGAASVKGSAGMTQEGTFSLTPREWFPNPPSLLLGAGDNSFGQLGDGTTENRAEFVEVFAKGVVDASVGEDHSLYLLEDGSLWAMGRNHEGQLGDGTQTDRTTPVQVVDSGVTSVSAGQRYSLFVKEDGSLWGMGSNSYGHMGESTDPGDMILSPKRIVDSGVVKVGSGYYKIIFLKEDGSLWGSGYNRGGQVGIPSTFSESEPAQIVESGVDDFFSGYDHVMYKKSDGSLNIFPNEYWAGDSKNRFDPALEAGYPHASIFQAVSGGAKISSFAVGSDGAVFYTLSDGSLWVLGSNFYGTLGTGDENPVTEAEKIIDGGVNKVYAGHQYAMFLKNDGSLWAIGQEWNESFGNGDSLTSNANTPTQILDGGVVQVAIGPRGSHSLVLSETGNYPPESLSGLTLIESSTSLDSYNGSFFSGLETIHFPSATELVGVGESNGTEYSQTYSFSGSYKWRVEGSRGYLSTTSEDGTWLNLYELSFDSNTTGRSDLLDDSNSVDYNATFELVSIGSGLAPLSIADVMLEFNASDQDIASGGTTYTFFENGSVLVSDYMYGSEKNQYRYQRTNPDTGVLTLETPSAAGTVGTDTSILTLDFSSAASGAASVKGSAGMTQEGTFSLTPREKIQIPLTDANFRTAIELWFTDEAAATDTYGHISEWNVSAVTDMSYAFLEKSTFNADLSKWDVSSVQTMKDMFSGAESFNQPIGDWNVSSVVDMSGMFYHARNFDQMIGSWDVASLTTMNGMFWGATLFNQDIGEWNVSRVTNIESIIDNAHSFNQDISSWDVSSVSNMQNAFFNAYAFDQDISTWDVSAALSMDGMFDNANSLSVNNKSKIQSTFSSNLNWPYEWLVSSEVEYIVSVITGTGGSASGGGSYQQGTELALNASPELGYSFIGWTGDLTSADNPLVLKASSNLSLTATFGPDLEDTDGDGLSNYDEIITHGTSPDKADSDEDGLNDKREIDVGMNPLQSDRDMIDKITRAMGMAGDSGPYTTDWFYLPHGSGAWIYSTQKLYPYFFDSKTESWLYFRSNESGPRFYHYNLKAWMNLNELSENW